MKKLLLEQFIKAYLLLEHPSQTNPDKLAAYVNNQINWTNKKLNLPEEDLFPTLSNQFTRYHRWVSEAFGDSAQGCWSVLSKATKAIVDRRLSTSKDPKPDVFEQLSRFWVEDYNARYAPALYKYETIRQRNPRLLTQAGLSPDINKVSLQDIVAKINDIVLPDNKGWDEKKRLLVQFIDRDAKFTKEDRGAFSLVKPENTPAFIKFGIGTDWCTSINNLNEDSLKYQKIDTTASAPDIYTELVNTRMEYPGAIILLHRGKPIAQIHTKSGQYMDIRDSELPIVIDRNHDTYENDSEDDLYDNRENSSIHVALEYGEDDEDLVSRVGNYHMRSTRSSDTVSGLGLDWLPDRLAVMLSKAIMDIDPHATNVESLIHHLVAETDANFPEVVSPKALMRMANTLWKIAPKKTVGDDCDPIIKEALAAFIDELKIYQVKQVPDLILHNDDVLYCYQELLRDICQAIMPSLPGLSRVLETISNKLSNAVDRSYVKALVSYAYKDEFAAAA